MSFTGWGWSLCGVISAFQSIEPMNKQFIFKNTQKDKALKIPIATVPSLTSTHSGSVEGAAKV
jgi:hypothetical protein